MSSVQPGPPSLHLPFDPGPYRMIMGLIATPGASWIEINHHYADQIALRRRLLTEQREEVFAGLPDGMMERRDLLATLTSHVCAHHPGWFVREGAVLHNRLNGTRWALDDLPDDPLVVAGQMVKEDLLVFSQALLSLQLPFAVLALVRFVSDKRMMGSLVISRGIAILAWLAAAVIAVLNLKLLFDAVVGG